MSELQQYAHALDLVKMTRVLQTLGLVKKNEPATVTVLNGSRLRPILLKAIEQTLERAPEHHVQDWGGTGWWYHGQLEEQEWVLLKLKFFL
jgi:hypothetical protein